MGKKDKKKDSDKSHKKERKGESKKLDGEIYEAALFELQAELVKLQRWVVDRGERIIVVFEGRDAAGKGGVIKRITEKVSPRIFRVVALPAPTEREKSQLYLQRYIAHFPAAGEIVLFDRSWYNRAGVERVLDFCTEEQYRRFLLGCPQFEKSLVDDGIRLFKYWFDVSSEEQERRMQARITDPTKIWKLSPMDLKSRRHWYDYSRARDDMFAATDTPHAPWYVVNADDKQRARLNCIAHLLNQIPYQEVPREEIILPEPDTTGAFDDQATLASRSFVPERF
ncbi:MAG: polyphosphate kinase 2 [Gammaproteobacteria bacterium]|nr:MAG: polyphosphate kinase 2 [Gammaproteobacteria bacterium]